MSNVIEQVKQALVDGDDLSQARVAREAGISDAVLCSLLAGNYVGNIPRNLGKLECWLKTRGKTAQVVEAASTVSCKAPTWQPLPTANAIMGVLSTAQALCRWGMVYEGAGVGKTETAERYQSKKSNVWILTASPFRNSETAVLQTLCGVLKIKNPGRTRAQMSEAIEKRLKGTKGLLIIDEAQYYPDRILNGIRIMTERRVGVVLLGNDVVRTRMSNPKTSSDMTPVWSRVISPLRVFTASDADIEQYIQAWGITNESIITYAKEKIPGSTGALRSLESMLKLAITLATTNGAELSLGHIEAAWVMLDEMAANEAAVKRNKGGAKK